MNDCLLDKYENGLKDIDDIFKVSKIIKDVVVSNLSKIDTTDSSNLNYSQKKTIENTLAIMSGLDPSIDNAEKSRVNRLYAQGIVLVVSLSEELLKGAFENLFSEKLETIDCIKDKMISLKEIADHNYELSRQNWVDIALTKIYDDKSPEEKINFQNIKTIEGIFKGYFSIDLNIEKVYEQRVHLYFQIRHIILHNNSRIDNKFISNLDKAGIPTGMYKVDAKIPVSLDDYTNCKEIFRNFFISLEEAIEKTSKGND